MYDHYVVYLNLISYSLFQKENKRKLNFGLRRSEFPSSDKEGALKYV